MEPITTVTWPSRADEAVLSQLMIEILETRIAAVEKDLKFYDDFLGHFLGICKPEEHREFEYLKGELEDFRKLKLPVCRQGIDSLKQEARERSSDLYADINRLQQYVHHLSKPLRTFRCMMGQGLL